MGAEAAHPYLSVKALIHRAAGLETEVTRSAATAIAVARPSAVNVHRLGMLGLNLGLWTLIVLVVRAL